VSDEREMSGVSNEQQDEGTRRGLPGWRGRGADDGPAGSRGGRGDRRRRVNRVLAFVLIGLAFVAVAAWGVWRHFDSRYYQALVENERQQDFYLLIEEVDSMESAMAKALVYSTPQQGTLLSEVWRHADGAETAINRLPLYQPIREQISRFLSQVGEYAYTLAGKNARGLPLSDAEWNTLNDLQGRTAVLGNQLRSLEDDAVKGGFRWSEVARRSRSLGGKTTDILQEAANDMREVVEERPPLNYDGQFSDELAQRLPRGLGDKTVSSSDAQQIAQRFLARPEEAYQVTTVGERQGNIPTYSVRLRPQAARQPTPDGGGQAEATGAAPLRWLAAARAALQVQQQRQDQQQAQQQQQQQDQAPEDRRNQPPVNDPAPVDDVAGDVFIDISKKGGNVIWMVNTRPVAQARVDTGRAVEQGREFLRQRGFGEVEPVHSLREGDTLVVVYAGIDEGVIVYPDRVVLRLALDRNEVIAFDASGWFTYHRPRNLRSAVEVSPEEAEQVLNPRLEVEDRRLTLILVGADREVLAYEFRARLGEEDTYLVYINAETGGEELILRQITTEEGKLFT